MSEPSAETLTDSERACLKRLGTTLRMHKADAVHPLDWHERMCVEKALRAYVAAEAQLEAVREILWTTNYTQDQRVLRARALFVLTPAPSPEAKP